MKNEVLYFQWSFNFLKYSIWIQKNGLASDLSCLCLIWWAVTDFYQHFSVSVVYNKIFFLECEVCISTISSFFFFFFNPLYFWPTTLVVFGFFLLSNQDWFIQLCWRHHNLIRICEVSLLGREGCTAPSVFKQLSWCFLICYFDFCVPLFGANQRIYAYKRMKINQNCIFMAAEYWSHKIICRNKYKLTFLCWWKNS